MSDEPLNADDPTSADNRAPEQEPDPETNPGAVKAAQEPPPELQGETTADE